VSDAETAGERETSDELLADLAHALTLLVRRDLELAVAEHGPQLRRVSVELVAALAAGVALLFALAALSWAAAQALTLAIPSWAASLIVAGAWAVVAGLLLLLDHPRRLLRRMSQATHDQTIESAEQNRRDAQHAVEHTAERLAQAVAREAAERELRRGFSSAEELIETAEHETEDLLKELIVGLLAPGRAGISLLERIVGRQ
jgi:Putative Actinobacterial Holin-X, holin superfamily III